jgi:hypothetical protein
MGWDALTPPWDVNHSLDWTVTLIMQLSKQAIPPGLPSWLWIFHIQSLGWDSLHVSYLVSLIGWGLLPQFQSFGLRCICPAFMAGQVFINDRYSSPFLYLSHLVSPIGWGLLLPQFQSLGSRHIWPALMVGLIIQFGHRPQRTCHGVRFVPRTSGACTISANVPFGIPSGPTLNSQLPLFIWGKIYFWCCF